MRRHATMGLALVLSCLVSVPALAQSTAASDAGGAKAPVKATTSTATTTATPAAAASTSTSVTTGAKGAADAAAPTATTAPAAAAPAPAAADPAKTVMDGPTYAVRLRDLEARVDELKDQIRRSHTRLALLSDTILSGGAAGSRADVQLENRMSNAFQMTQAVVVIDGAVQYNHQDETGALSEQQEIPIFTGSIPPGDHTVQVLLNFRGNGYGVFTYLRGYKFEVKSSHSFTAVEGKALTLTATALERGGVTTPLEQRPAIEWHEKFQPITAAAGVAAPAPAPAPAASGAKASVGTGSVSGGASIGGGSK